MRPPHRPRRVRVVGTSGAGKTTLAARAGARLGLPLLEVDAVVHREGWRTATQMELDEALAAFLGSPAAAGGWVMDGNYWSRLSAVTDTADTVVWLDYPRRLVMARLLRRTLGRVLTRRTLWNGNRERVRNLLRREPLDNILVWAWTQHAGYRERYTALAAADGERTWVRLRRPRDARRWLAGL